MRVCCALQRTCRGQVVKAASASAVLRVASAAQTCCTVLCAAARCFACQATRAEKQGRALCGRHCLVVQASCGRRRCCDGGVIQCELLIGAGTVVDVSSVL